MSTFLSCLSTVIPPHSYQQEDILQFMLLQSPEDSKIKRSLSSIYSNSGIRFRHSVLPDFKMGRGAFFSQERPPSTKDRMVIYSNEAFELGRRVIDQIDQKLQREGEQLGSVTHLAWVSCTGLISPGIETKLLQSFDFQLNTQTTAFNFLGCHGFFHALRYAEGVAKSDPQARVLVVCAELCTLHFQPVWHTDTLLAQAIFGDAAAGLIVSSVPFGAKSIEIVGRSQSYFPEKADAMTWNLGESGFDMRLAQDLPSQLEHVVHQALATLFNRSKDAKNEVKHWLFHPGGKRILDRLEQTLGLQSSDLKASRKALEMTGNVSSASILFVMEQFFKAHPKPGNNSGVLLGVGPGLALESVLFRY